MPYITKDLRHELKFRAPDSVGELNYAISMLLVQYLKHKGLRYATLNDIVGAIESAKAEFQRRVVNPYEDSCIQKNGDIYDS